MEAFREGVIAIVITIMVPESQLAQDLKTDSAGQPPQHLKSLLPCFVAYLFSFRITGIYWSNHHDRFYLLEKTDERLTWQHLFFLFRLSLILMPKALIGSNPFLAVPRAAYGFVLLMCSLPFTLMRHYTIKRGLVHQDEDHSLDRETRLVTIKAKAESYAGTAGYLLSIPLAFVQIYIA